MGAICMPLTLKLTLVLVIGAHCQNLKVYEKDEDTRETKSKACFADENCEYGEICNLVVCRCPSPNRGELCDSVEVDTCTEKIPKCISSRGECKYDKSRRIFCDCKSKAFHPDKEECSDACISDSGCKYGEKCLDEVCKCPSSDLGELCDAVEKSTCTEKIPKCLPTGGECKYNQSREVFCDCKLKIYHTVKEACTEKCTSNNMCEFGEICYGGFCRCPYGIGLNVCDDVQERVCSEVFSKCLPTGGVCKYNRNRTVKCDCGTKHFHPEKQECTDVCSPNPCNGGTCAVMHGKIKCTCPDWLTGEFCETDLCSSNPCNGGICNIVQGKVKCTCPDWLTGQFCETEHPCAKHSCSNEGVCKADNDGRPQCYCKVPFSGKSCENDPCSKNPCHNGGSCFVVDNSFKCFCQEPFLGTTCDNDPCSTNPCSNGGSCFVVDKAFKCFCRDPFSGSTCENDNRYMWVVIALSVLVLALLLCLGHFVCQRRPSPLRSPDLNPCDFWLWGNLKHLVSCDNPRTLPDLKGSISQHVGNISPNTLRSAVEHAILRFKMVTDTDGRHIEHALL